MPTGYTQKLMEQDQSFDEFVLRCARAFGACVMMRDDDMSAPIPDQFEPGSYYQKSVDEKSAELTRLESMTNEERLAFGAKSRADGIERNREYIAEEGKQNARLSAMQRSVADWTPPSADHEELKKFMLHQIEISYNHSPWWDEQVEKYERATDYDTWSEAADDARKSLEYAQKNLQDELERIAMRNNWIRLLKASLPGKER